MTPATRDKHVAAAQRRIAAAKTRRDKARATVAECDAVLAQEEANVAWLKSAPVDVPLPSGDDQPGVVS